MKKSIRITTPDVEDIDRIYEIEKSSFKDYWDKKSLLELFGGNGINHFIVILVDDVISGYSLFRTIFDEAELLQIAVDEEYRGQELGKELLNSTIKIIENFDVENFFLEVRVSNEVAINLYKSFGFEKIYTRKNYYQNSEDALVMQMKIGE